MSKKDFVDIGHIFNFVTGVLRPFRKYLIIIGSMVLIQTILKGFKELAIKYVLDNIILSDYAAVVWLGILIGNTFALEISHRISDKFNYRYKPRIKQYITKTTTKMMLQYQYSFYQSKNSAELAACIVNIHEGTEEIIEVVVEHFFRFMLSLLITSVYALTVSPTVSLMLLVWSIVWILISVWAGCKMYILNATWSKAEVDLEGNLMDMFEHIFTVHSMNNTKHELSNIDNWTERVVRTETKLRDMQFKFWLFQGFAFCVINGMILFYVVYLYNQGLATIGDISLVFGLVGDLYNELWDLAKQVRELTDCMGKIGQGLKLIDVQSAYSRDSASLPRLAVTKGAIAFENISFSYPQAITEDSTQLFDGRLSFDIKPGEFVGFIGPSGSGKSTLMKLLLRLYELEGGRILIDGQDISQFTVDSLRNNLAVIPQDTGIFEQRSIAENIAYGAFETIDEHAMDAIIKAAKQTQAHDFIMSLPEQYNTVLKDHGINLSGGQRQRIAIARGFARNASIFLFDEATSALDNITQQSVQKQIRELVKGKTVMVVAHRLHTVKDADKIFVFDKGQLVQSGKHDELIAEPGLYNTMWESC